MFSLSNFFYFLRNYLFSKHWPHFCKFYVLNIFNLEIFFKESSYTTGKTLGLPHAISNRFNKLLTNILKGDLGTNCCSTTFCKQYKLPK